MSGSIVQSDLDHHHAEDLERSGNSRTPVEDESAPDPVLAPIQDLTIGNTNQPEVNSAIDNELIGQLQSASPEIRGEVLEMSSLLGSECSVCLEQIEIFGFLENCQHLFCSPCLTIWRQTHLTCPFCRQCSYRAISVRSFPTMPEAKEALFRRAFSMGQASSRRQEDSDAIFEAIPIAGPAGMPRNQTSSLIVRDQPIEEDTEHAWAPPLRRLAHIGLVPPVNFASQTLERIIFGGSGPLRRHRDLGRGRPGNILFNEAVRLQHGIVMALLGLSSSEVASSATGFSAALTELSSALRAYLPLVRRRLADERLALQQAQTRVQDTRVTLLDLQRRVEAMRAADPQAVAHIRYLESLFPTLAWETALLTSQHDRPALTPADPNIGATISRLPQRHLNPGRPHPRPLPDANRPPNTDIQNQIEAAAQQLWEASRDVSTFDCHAYTIEQMLDQTELHLSVVLEEIRGVARNEFDQLDPRQISITRHIFRSANYHLSMDYSPQGDEIGPDDTPAIA